MGLSRGQIPTDIVRSEPQSRNESGVEFETTDDTDGHG